MVLVTRRDLIPGYQVVQPSHALAEFAVKYPKVFRIWQRNQKNLVVLSIANELALVDLFNRAVDAGVKCVMFKEPDIGNEVTAIAMEPCEVTYRLTSSIPLTLKDNMADGRKALGG